MTEVLQARNHRKELPPSGAIITLGVHNAGEKAMGRSTPSTMVESIAPTATSDASVSKIKFDLAVDKPESLSRRGRA